jgi:hypothetical protein
MEGSLSDLAAIFRDLRVAHSGSANLHSYDVVHSSRFRLVPQSGRSYPLPSKSTKRRFNETGAADR